MTSNAIFVQLVETSWRVALKAVGDFVTSGKREKVVRKPTHRPIGRIQQMAILTIFRKVRRNVIGIFSVQIIVGVAGIAINAEGFEVQFFRLRMALLAIQMGVRSD